MSKENKEREFYVDLIDLQRCDKTLDLGEGSGCRVVYYPHRDDLYRLVRVIQYSELQSLEQRLAEAITLKEAYQDEASASYKEIKALEQRLAEVEKQLAIAVDALEEGWQLAQHYGEFESIEKIENALKQIEELSK